METTTSPELLGRLNSSKGEIAAYCQRWNIIEFALFGSVLRDDFGPESDVDVLVRYAPDTRFCLADYVKMQDDIEALLGRSVDLVERGGVERSRNWIRREAILNSAQWIYAA